MCACCQGTACTEPARYSYMTVAYCCLTHTTFQQIVRPQEARLLVTVSSACVLMCDLVTYFCLAEELQQPSMFGILPPERPPLQVWHSKGNSLTPLQLHTSGHPIWAVQDGGGLRSCGRCELFGAVHQPKPPAGNHFRLCKGCSAS